MFKLLKFLISKEFFFVLFLTSGYFKSAESKINITVIFLVITILLTLKDSPTTINKKTLMPVFLFSALFMLVLMAFLYSPSSAYSIEKLIKFVTITTPSFLLGLIMVRSKESIIRLLWSVVIIGVSMSVFAVHLFVSNNAELGFIGLGDGNYLGLGRITGLTFLILLTRVTFIKEPRIKTVFIIGLSMLTFAALSVTGARMPLISVLIVSVLIILNSIRIKKGILYVSRGFKYLVLLILIGVSLVSWLMSKGFLNIIVYRISVLVTESGGGASAEGRLDRFEEAFEMFSTNPFFGKGLGSFPIFYTGTESADYPHNIFLEFLSEFGMLGLTLFIILILSCLALFIKNGLKNIEMERFALLVCFLFLFLNANTTGDINDNRMLFAFLAIFHKYEIIFAELYKKKGWVFNEKKSSKRISC